MQSIIDDIDKIISNLSQEEASIGIRHTSTPVMVTTTVNDESSPTTEHNATAASNQNDMSNREYCLIIFNNPRWSNCLRRKQTPSTTGPATVAATQSAERTIKKSKLSSTATVSNQQPQNASFDDQFTAQLRQLITNYMMHTTRPFPVRYFIDFTTD